MIKRSRDMNQHGKLMVDIARGQVEHGSHNPTGHAIGGHARPHSKGSERRLEAATRRTNHRRLSRVARRTSSTPNDSFRWQCGPDDRHDHCGRGESSRIPSARPVRRLESVKGVLDCLRHPSDEASIVAALLRHLRLLREQLKSEAEDMATLARVDSVARAMDTWGAILD